MLPQGVDTASQADGALAACFSSLQRHLGAAVLDLQQMHQELSQFSVLLPEHVGDLSPEEAPLPGSLPKPWPVASTKGPQFDPVKLHAPYHSATMPLRVAPPFDRTSSASIDSVKTAPPAPASLQRVESAWQRRLGSFTEGGHSKDLFQVKAQLLLPDTMPAGRVFADADAIKDCIQDRLLTEDWQEKDYYHDAGHFFADIARSNRFQALSFFIVFVSSIWIAVEIDSDESSVVHITVSQAFCTFFVFELGIQWLAFKDKRNVVKDGAFVFDLFLVLLIVLETWLLPVVYFISSTNSSSTDNMRVVMIFRVLRFFKVLRLAKVLRQVPELLIIVRGVFMAYKAISFTFILIAVIVYAGALLFRVLLEDTTLGAERFRSVPVAMGTLLIEATLSGSRGGSIIREANDVHLTCALAVLLYVVLANVTMMGVLGGLLVQAVKTVTEVEKAESDFHNLFDLLNQLWHLALEHDYDGDKSITLPEFQAILRDQDTIRELNRADVDMDSLFECSDFIFSTCSEDGKLSRKQFLQCVMDHRGKQAAKVKDHIHTRRLVCSTLQGLCLQATPAMPPGDFASSPACYGSLRHLAGGHPHFSASLE